MWFACRFDISLCAPSGFVSEHAHSRDLVRVAICRAGKVGQPTFILPEEDECVEALEGINIKLKRIGSPSSGTFPLRWSGLLAFSILLKRDEAFIPSSWPQGPSFGVSLQTHSQVVGASVGCPGFWNCLEFYLPVWPKAILSWRRPSLKEGLSTRTRGASRPLMTSALCPNLWIE